jgi:hypothetical protein
MGFLRIYQVPKWCPCASTKYQNGVPTLLLPNTKMGPLIFFYQVPKWCPYASIKYQNEVPALLQSTKMGSPRFYQVLKWVPTLLLPSAKMGSFPFFFKAPKWGPNVLPSTKMGPYTSSTKYRNGVPTRLLSTGKLCVATASRPQL